MLSVLIKYLIAKLETFEYLDKVHGLSTTVQVGDETMPAVYSGNELVHVNFDSYDSLVYIQQNGKVGRETNEHPAVACKYNVVERYPLRLIVYSQGKENVNCESYSQQIADSIKAALNGKQQTLETAANLTNATIILGDTDLDKNSVWQTQFSSPNQLNDSDILIAIDLEFEIEGDDTCFANNPCENSEFVFDLETQTFCERVEECLDIPTDNGQYVLTITDNVISWDEFSASGLVDGNGTTINGNKVDLGGNVIQDTILSFDPSQFLFAIGDLNSERTLYFGDAQNDGSYIFGVNGYDSTNFNGGDFQISSSNDIYLNSTNDISVNATNNLNLGATVNTELISQNVYIIASASFDVSAEQSSVINVNNNSGFSGTLILAPYDNVNQPAVGLYLTEDQVDNYGFFAINDGINKYANIYYGVFDVNNNVTDTSRVAATANEIHGRKFITVGGNYNGFHCNTTYSQLEYNKQQEDDQATGTLLVLDADGVSHYQNGAILNQFDNSGNLLFGDSITDGTWKFFLDSGNFSIQKRESGSWVTKQTWT